MAGKLASQVRGLSEARFREADGTGERCRAAVEELRWPKGFACPLCGSCEAAASTGDDRRPRKIELPPVEGSREEEVRKLVAERPASTGRLVTDGLGCRTAAAEAGLGHAATATGGGKRAAGRSPFRRVDTTPGNVEAALAGACRRVGPEHAGRHLASSARRHDRRFRPEGLIPRLVLSAVRTDPPPNAKLVAG
jgi:Transposase zinc-ribbon domain